MKALIIVVLVLGTALVFGATGYALGSREDECAKLQKQLVSAQTKEAGSVIFDLMRNEDCVIVTATP